MKYILIIGDGMADNPVPTLDNKTPLQHANIPVMDALAAKGEVGNVINCLPAVTPPSCPFSAQTPTCATPAAPPWKLLPPASSSSPVTFLIAAI